MKQAIGGSHAKINPNLAKDDKEIKASLKPSFKFPTHLNES